MKIVILGNFRVNYTSESDYKYTLEKMGHEVVALQETEATGEKVLAASLQTDALFWIHTWGWDTPGLSMKEVLTKLKEANIPSFTYHLDLILPLNRQEEMHRTGYDQVDHFFTVENDFANYLNERKDLAIGHYLPPAVIERDCFMADPDPNFPYDIIFTGSYNYHLSWPYRKKLLDWLIKTYGHKFHRWGHAGPDNPSPYIMGTKLNEIYASAKIVIGDSFCPNFTQEKYWSNRIPETLGKGGFLIHPFVKGLDLCYNLKSELVTYEYNNFEELQLKINYFLQNPEERELIRLRGHKRVKRDHTFTNRLETMLKIVCTKT